MGNCLKAVSSSNDDISLLRDATSIPRESSSSEQLGPPPPYQETMNQQSLPVYYPSPNVGRPASQLTEEEQIKIAQRMGLIQHLPTGEFDGSKKNKECAICMGDFMIGDPIRFLPCMHIYHTECIDDWLMRSFTCPSCMEPVDAALLSSYQTD
ncbi:RING finger protein 11-like protein [Leptotrombidium deliense]|uniref:RING finger protein 11-like protein n=1 Tax=Leptotrombidium deliense TaxID=299467 RepID=A0A443SP47_9ACAR|nr:RING finger protein 11-like protein [Leptotrombidium deliense]